MRAFMGVRRKGDFLKMPPTRAYFFEIVYYIMKDS